MCHVGFAITEFSQLFQRQLSGRIVCRADADGNKSFFQIKTHRFFFKDFRFQIFYRIGDVRRQQFNLIRDFRQMFNGMQNHAGRGVHKGRIASSYDFSIF